MSTNGASASVIAWAVISWLGVAAVEFWSVPNLSLLTYLVLPGEFAVWAAAALLTARILGGSRRARVGMATAIALPGLFLTNWSVLQPDSYYAVHRIQFDRVASLIEDGTVGIDDDLYYGEPLPLPLRDLATTGRVRSGPEGSASDVVVLPEAMGLGGEMVGYLYLRPGRTAPPDARPIEGRWWWGGPDDD